MKQINKRPSAEVIEGYKELRQKTASPDFEDLKKEMGAVLKDSLLAEQGYLCCYCMNSIEERVYEDGSKDLKMKIEHFESQDDYPDKVTDYNNLFAACKGGEDLDGKDRFCDSAKGNTELKYIPNPASIRKKDEERSFNIRYNPRGAISSKDPNIDKELKETLKLNAQTLVRLRKQAWAVLSGKIDRYDKRTKSWETAVDYARDLLAKLEQPKNGRYTAFQGMLIYLLKKRFKELR